MEAGSSMTIARPGNDAPECVICGTALAGPLGAIFRLAGINRRARNPNLCNRCNTHVEEGRVVELTPISVGNPHAVIWVDNVAAAPVTTLGPALEHHAAFPERPRRAIG